MFDIQEVTLTNFRSYKGIHHIEFPKKPGLYLVTGQNKAEPRLGANGVGKSTLLDAIYWCFYGKTPRGLKAGDVITWGEKSCSVTVKVFIGSDTFEITRNQSPNSLMVRGPVMTRTDVSQDYLQRILRIGPEAFLYAVMLPQFGQSFFDLAPAAKLTLFSEIMELEYWLHKSKAAEALAAEINDAKAAVESEMSRYRGQLEVFDTDMSGLKKLSDGFADARDVKILELGVSDLDGLQQNLVGRDDAVEWAEKAVKNATLKLEKLEKKAAKCPTCGQPTPDQDREALLHNISDFERQLQRLGYERRQTEHEIKRLQAQVLNEKERQNPYEGQILQKQHNKSSAEKEAY